MSPIIFGRDLTGNEISIFPVPGYENVPPQFNVCRTILSLVEVMTSAEDILSLEKKRFWPFQTFRNDLKVMSNRRFTVVTDITVTNKIQMKVVSNFTTR